MLLRSDSWDMMHRYRHHGWTYCQSRHAEATKIYMCYRTCSHDQVTMPRYIRTIGLFPHSQSSLLWFPVVPSCEFCSPQHFYNEQDRGSHGTVADLIVSPIIHIVLQWLPWGLSDLLDRMIPAIMFILLRFDACWYRSNIASIKPCKDRLPT